MTNNYFSQSKPSFRLIFLLLGILGTLFLLSSCTISEPGTNLLTSTPGQDRTTPTLLIPSTMTATPVPTSTPTALEKIGDSIALGFRYTTRGECSREDNRVVVIHPDNAEHSLVLENQDAGYSQPQWSPSGDWLSFLLTVPASKANTSELPSESIWLMRPDGSELQRISKEVEFQVGRTSSSCYSKAGLINYLWSPGETSILYSHHATDPISAQSTRYYSLIWLSNGISIEILQTDIWDPLGYMFVSEEKLLFWGFDKIIFITIDESGELIRRDISYPIHIPNLDWVPSIHNAGDEKLAVVFPQITGTDVSSVRRQVWILDSVSDEWMKAGETNDFGLVSINSGLLAACDYESKRILIYNLKSLEFQRSIEIETPLFVECSTVNYPNPDSTRAYVIAHLRDPFRFSLIAFDIGDENFLPVSVFDQSNVSIKLPSNSVYLDSHSK